MAPVTAVKSKTDFKIRHRNLLQPERKNAKQVDVGTSRHQSGVATSTRIPTKPNEISSNWRTLLTALSSNSSSSTFVHKVLPQKNGANKTKSQSRIDGEKKVDNQSEHEDIWFDNIDPILLVNIAEERYQKKNTNVKPGLTEALALDCEMVGVGYDGKESVLARVSIVNQRGDCVYDKYVLPGEKVTDYRTHVSGIRPHNLLNASDLGVVREEVMEMLRGRLLIGHSLRNDLQVLLIKHPKCMIRDTSRFKHFRAAVNGTTPSLKFLANQFLGIKIQTGEHSSVQDARVAMHLYTMFRQKWEAELSALRKEKRTKYRTRKCKTVKTSK